METLMNIDHDFIGLLIWVVWALIGAFEALVMQRYMGGRRILWFDIIIGVVSAVIGGFLSTRFLGDTPLMLFLISILSAIFFSFIMLWIVGALVTFFRKDEHLD